MNRTKIEYLDLTWNPVAGCSGVGCAVRGKCWARAMAKRLGRYCEVCPSFVPHVHFERFDEPLQRKKPAIIGVAFMGEFYDKEIAENIRYSLYMRMEKAHWHTFFILTKQPQNIDLMEPIPPNVWIGVSVNRKDDLWRIDELRQTNALVKVVSFEPLYENVPCNLENIDWIIIGAQTRPKLELKPEWIHELTALAWAYNIPVFHKDNLGLKFPLREFPRALGAESHQK